MPEVAEVRVAGYLVDGEWLSRGEVTDVYSPFEFSLDRALRWIDEAVSDGARILCGGGLHLRPGMSQDGGFENGAVGIESRRDFRSCKNRRTL